MIALCLISYLHQIDKLPWFSGSFPCFFWEWTGIVFFFMFVVAYFDMFGGGLLFFFSHCTGREWGLVWNKNQPNTHPNPRLHLGAQRRRNTASGAERKRGSHKTAPAPSSDNSVSSMEYVRMQSPARTEEAGEQPAPTHGHGPVGGGWAASSQKGHLAPFVLGKTETQVKWTACECRL